MLSAIEQLIRFHPASHIGRLGRQEAGLEVFEDFESRHVRRGQEDEYETERSKPLWMIGELAATAAILVIFCGVLTVIARLVVDSPNTIEPQVVEISDAAEPR
ncbi:MAG TPA: hypothetical protein VE914_04210 [Candidatus Angelobacter sp.]|nr:hypothetical protein [Candidatus Angelobacter sp.]